MRPAAHGGPAASFPAPVDSMQGRCKERSRCRWRPSTCASSLAAGISSRLCHRKVPVPLRFLLSTLLMRMKKKATDRFMRDTIGCCYGAQGFLLLHHTMHDQRPVFSGNTVCGVFWPWPAVLDHSRRMASLSCFILSKQALYLLIQYSRRVYWLLRTSVRKIGLLGFHRPPLSGGQVGLSHRSRRERVFVHKRKHGGMGSRLTRKACPGCMRELQKTSLGMMLRARWTRSTSCPLEHVVRLQAAQW